MKKRKYFTNKANAEKFAKKVSGVVDTDYNIKGKISYIVTYTIFEPFKEL